MDKNETKREIRKAFKAAGESVSKSSTTAVYGFHSASDGWNIDEFAGQIQLNYVRGGLAKTTVEDLERGAAILVTAGLNAYVHTHNVAIGPDRIIVNY